METTIAWERGEGRPSPLEVAREIAQKKGELRSSDFVKKLARQIRGYLGGTGQPNADTAFDIGEALADLGYDWIHGLPMVYGASGHLDDIVGTIATMIYERYLTYDVIEPNGNTDGVLDDLFSMLMTLGDLWLATNGDNDPTLSILHRSTDLTIGNAFAVHWMITTENKNLDGCAFPKGKSALNLLKREIAKRASAAARIYRFEFLRAWTLWRQQRNMRNYGPAEWVNSALIVARDAYTDAKNKLDLTSLIVGQWFTNLSTLDDTPLPPWVLSERFNWSCYLPDENGLSNFSEVQLFDAIRSAESSFLAVRGGPFFRRMAAAHEEDAAARDAARHNPNSE